MPQAKKPTPSIAHLAERFPKWEQPVFLIDAGHGGIIDGEYQTSGKRSPKWPDGRQLFEGEFNRDIRNRVCEMMDRVGLHYKKIADTEEDVPLHERSKAITSGGDP